MSNKTIKKIAWHIPKKQLIKFVGDDDSFAIDESVDGSVKYAKNETVEYVIKDDKIISLSKVDNVDQPKEEVKKETKTKEEKPEESKENIENKKVTLMAIARNKTVIKYEGCNDWIHVSEELQKNDYKEIGLLARNEVDLTLTNGLITDVKLLNKPELNNTENTQSVKSTYGKRDEIATDKRTASMNAKDIVRSLIDNKNINIDKIDNAIKHYTKLFYETAKNL